MGTGRGRVTELSFVKVMNKLAPPASYPPSCISTHSERYADCAYPHPVYRSRVTYPRRVWVERRA